MEKRYFNFSAGYRRVFGHQKLFSPFIEATLYGEIYTSDNYILKRLGAAIAPQIGTIVNFSNKVYGVIQVFYKSGVLRYNSKRLRKAYIPYAYGIQIGVGFNL